MFARRGGGLGDYGCDYGSERELIRMVSAGNCPLPMNLDVAASRQSAAISIAGSLRRSTEAPLRFRGSKREISFGRNLTLALSRWEREQPPFL